MGKLDGYLLLFGVVDLRTLLVCLLVGVLDYHVGALLGLGEDGLLHLLYPLLYVSCHHYQYIISNPDLSQSSPQPTKMP